LRALRAVSRNSFDPCHKLKWEQNLLPRLPAGVDWTMGFWAGRVEVLNAAAQGRLPADDPATASCTPVNLALRCKSTNIV